MNEFSRNAHRTLIGLAACSALALGLAQAQSEAPAQPAPPAQATAPGTPPLTIRDIYDRVEAAGYLDVREIEWDSGRYEVKARNAQGERVKLYINAYSGAVERTRTYTRN